jgi:hypothetical protein
VARRLPNERVEPRLASAAGASVVESKKEEGAVASGSVTRAVGFAAALVPPPGAAHTQFVRQRGQRGR